MGEFLRNSRAVLPSFVWVTAHQNMTTPVTQWGMMEGMPASGIGSLWPTATTRGLPGPRRAPVPVSQGTWSHWAGKLILTHMEFGIRADSS